MSTTKSFSRAVTCGMPQETVLGPLLFEGFVNSLLKKTTVENIVSYCDDAVIFCKANTWNEFTERDLNEQKTKYMFYFLKPKKLNTSA